MASFPLSAEEIADALSIRKHKDNVVKFWPLIEQCMDALQVGSINSKIAALATIAVETNWEFAPIRELGSLAYLQSKKYFPYYGRGFGQLTWEDAYRLYGNAVGVDLLNEPELACEPNVSASVFAAQWRDKRCHVLADQEDWHHVRIRWNGGTNGEPDYLKCVAALRKAIAYPVADLSGEISM